MTRTFSAETWRSAQGAWADFGPEWRDVRHKAAMGGLIFPPSGTRWDSWDDDSPSQRAIVIRALRETPKLLDRCLIGAPTWTVVIARLTRARDQWRDDQRVIERYFPERPATHSEAVRSLAQILERIESAR